MDLRGTDRSGLGHYPKDTTKYQLEFPKKGVKMCRKFVENAPLNSKGTTSDWKNIKDYMRESEHFIIAQRDGTQIIFFLSGLHPKRFQKERWQSSVKLIPKKGRKIRRGPSVGIIYILLMLVSVSLTV